MGPGKIRKTWFLPQHVRIRNEDGRIVNDREKADTFAEFYENKQWKCERGARGTRNKQNSAERNTRHQNRTCHDEGAKRGHTQI